MFCGNLKWNHFKFLLRRNTFQCTVYIFFDHFSNIQPFWVLCHFCRPCFNLLYTSSHFKFYFLFVYFLIDYWCCYFLFPFRFFSTSTNFHYFYYFTYCVLFIYSYSFTASVSYNSIFGLGFCLRNLVIFLFILTFLALFNDYLFHFNVLPYILKGMLSQSMSFVKDFEEVCAMYQSVNNIPELYFWELFYYQIYLSIINWNHYFFT